MSLRKEDFLVDGELDKGVIYSLRMVDINHMKILHNVRIIITDK